MALDTSPFFDRLGQSQRVIVAGAGGGYDVLLGLPLYFYLKARGKAVTLASLSSSNLFGVDGRELRPNLIEVGAGAGGSKHFFPEKVLCQWFASRGEAVNIWCFHRTGAIPLAEAYAALVEETKADTVVLVDGDADSLLCGDEAGLGTPHEDIASLAAVDQLSRLVKQPQKLLVCTGLGADASKNLCHAQVLRAVAQLSASGGFLGSCSLRATDPEVKPFREAAEFVAATMPDFACAAAASIATAAGGEYGGDPHVSPLMSILWTFDLTAVAKRCLYMGQVKRTRTYRELNLVIEAFRNGLAETLDWETITL
jgi:hypothetical protein